MINLLQETHFDINIVESLSLEAYTSTQKHCNPLSL